jgi:hypothetical protein
MPQRKVSHRDNFLSLLVAAEVIVIIARMIFLSVLGGNVYDPPRVGAAIRR